MNLNSFVIDRPLRGMMLHSGTGEVMWTINQIEDPSLQVSAETADAVDALGVPIMSFDRAKSAEFSASSSLFDLGLLAAQSGSELEKSDASTKIVTPCFEEITRGTGESATLKHTPKGTAITITQNTHATTQPGGHIIPPSRVFRGAICLWIGASSQHSGLISA